MEHANDLRVQRTYKLLTDALMNMLCEQSFDTITVRTLCERAMVRPATFYKHFANKEELSSPLCSTNSNSSARETHIATFPEVHATTM